MATTTNYAWETPDDTDLVKDGAAAIRTLGSSIDTTTKALNPSTTLGDIEYRSATANTNTRLGIGTTGQVLTVSGGVPSWATPAGGGKVLQVVQGTSSSAVSIASSTFTDSGLSASITPSSASSKVLVLVMQEYQALRAYQYSGMNGRLLRGATQVFTSYKSGDNLVQMGTSSASQDNSIQGYLAMNYLDSPATTSATTYKVQLNVNTTANSASVEVRGTIVSTIILLEIGA